MVHGEAMRQRGRASGSLNTIVILDAESIDHLAGDLGAILVDCVEGGASVQFMEGLTVEEAATVFHAIAARVRRGESVLFGAYGGELLRGTIEVVLAAPPNQPRRAEVSKLLVHRAARWRGLGRALVLAAEEEARRRGKALLSLDTTVGSLAERLFAGLGYRRVGVIPGYALHPNGLPSDAIFFWKPL